MTETTVVISAIVTSPSARTTGAVVSITATHTTSTTGQSL
ncbi:hypothetical protein RISK_002510 [Rhodopirellula islandica]|uniref:Uncharacterized protein n=1 Tax=Rhodopirellula islandica TaxID=595434 RepID=A0A0J1BH76_RHOIS|nr:hypothetical protein RISK_002510 [Rhodopirellula islandica]